jgi:hypothetical protein
MLKSTQMAELILRYHFEFVGFYTLLTHVNFSFIFLQPDQDKKKATRRWLCSYDVWKFSIQGFVRGLDLPVAGVAESEKASALGYRFQYRF